jgi:catechol 2,3-dioxygenase-like lactoylglutathione lyase family enzyme
MFDHVTIRVPNLTDATPAFAAVLDELEVKQTMSTPSFSVWGNFALTQTDEEHPIARRLHLAFIAPTPAHVERFGQAGVGSNRRHATALKHESQYHCHGYRSGLGQVYA